MFSLIKIEGELYQVEQKVFFILIKEVSILRNNKKVIVSLVVSVLALAVLIASSLALFTDAKSASANGKAGTVKIDLEGAKFTHKYQGQTSVNNINPGDNDPEKKPGQRPGTEHAIEFDVSNKGNKSVITRHTIIITATKNGAVIDPSVFFLLTGNPLAKITPTEVVKSGGKVLAIKYVLYPADIYNGIGTNAEIETGGLTGVKHYVVPFGMDRLADNSYQGVDVKVDIIVEAMQYRNTVSTDWATIATKTVSIVNGVSVKVVPEQNQDAKGNAIP